jgi:hypothetical protein
VVQTRGLDSPAPCRVLIAMPTESFLERQEHVQNLSRFSQRLAGALGQSAPGPDQLRPALCAAVSGECVQCGIRITGEELIELSQPAETAESNPKIARLRQGYCARNHCDSYYYRLTFRTHPDLDWTMLLSRADSLNEAQALPAAVEEDTNKTTPGVGRRRLVGRIFVALAVVSLLLLVRQWYRGGRIPLIREPENFQVDHLPPDRQIPE